ncbi:MAG: phosphate ABC transporter, permease protein PstA, partial [Angelakisella sp.]
MNHRSSHRSVQPLSLVLRFLVWAAATATLAILVFLIGYVLIKGLPHITPSLFSLTYNSQNVSLLPSVITTVEMTFFSLLIAVPLGVFTAIYLVEYARRGSRAVELIRLTAETLSGIPSIIYGLFG